MTKQSLTRHTDRYNENNFKLKHGEVRSIGWGNNKV